MRTYLGYIASLLILGMGACNPCKDHVDVYYTSEEIKPYLFKTGTYWVYEEQTTGKIDSQSVIFDNTTFEDDGAIKPSKCGDTHYQWYEAVIYDTLYFEYQKVFKYYNIAGLFNPDELSIYGNNNNNQSIMPVYVVGLNVGKSIRLATLTQTYNDFVVKGTTYYQVSVFRIDTSSQMEYVSDYYWSPNIGVIRRIEYDTPDGTLTWDLINKNIVQ